MDQKNSVATPTLQSPYAGQWYVATFAQALRPGKTLVKTIADQEKDKILSFILSQTMSKPQPIRPTLYEQDLPTDPLLLFQAWLEEARLSDQVYEYSAMTLATATPDGRPAARIVLLRGYDRRGFCFYTNYESRKGEEMDANPQVALLFWWGALGRQIRIEGQIARLREEESDAYYHSRPLGSRLGAWVSPQSRVIPSRQQLEADLHKLEAIYPEQAPSRPPFWGGYRVTPVSFEFWQSGAHRLHDRLRYTQQADGGWRLERLAP